MIMIMIMRINPIFKICEIHKMNHDATVKGIENIINNKELGDLFNNVIKSINQNIEHTIDNDNDDDNVEEVSPLHSNEDVFVDESQQKENNALTLLDTLSLILVDKNGKNIADILTDINQNLSIIAENTKKDKK